MGEHAGASQTELSRRVAGVEDRLARFEMDRDRKDKELNEKYETLRVGLENEALAREILQERKLKELKLVESGVTLDLNLERQGRMEAEMRVAKSLDDRCIALSVELGAHTYGAGAGGGGGAARGEQGDDSRVLEALAAERDRRLQEEVPNLSIPPHSPLSSEEISLRSSHPTDYSHRVR
ncbi:hypothetical protein T484DRAFT_2548480 [Baffinella frigidus]|nr:hypothetical protein T484DRAFT_2548480 [Cryptophyta sp. CCMP2293]